MTKLLDLKSTINLPRTDFPMKAQLPKREPEQLEQWNQYGLYHRILESRRDAPLFVFHDGPPYPTGDIHLGTGLNKICKDMVIKSKTMAGFRVPYIPGWDCHGLPIETKVEKDLGGKKDSVTAAEFRRMCREFATKYIDSNRRDFKRLGIFGQWETPYLTMDHDHEAVIASAFLTFFEKGYVYKGLKPVYWCLHDRTALAEAEVEYENHTSPSIYVRFKLAQDGADADKIPAALRDKNVYGVIWTTTPWTIPASMALAFKPDFEYAAIETSEGDVELVARQLQHGVWEVLGRKIPGKALATYTGSELESAHLKFQHPFLDRLEPAVLADYVTLDQGTGIVHTAPGHGADDFRTGQKYGIATYAPLDDDGRFTEGLPEYMGKTVFEANPIIIKLLESRGALLAQGKLQHSYPHCWRCHNPVIFRATEQWFIDLQHDDLRRHALEEIRKVKWSPAWGEERLSSMVAERPDWCISRQRFWGVPLVVFYCEQCGEQLKDFHALRNVISWFEKEGADAWFTHSAEELLPLGTKCKCGSTRFRKEKDILDVWFESGSTSLAVLKGDMWPADVYLEGPDQYRGWFQSSLLVAIGTRGRAPYKQVVTHGWTLDADGRPMSKSAGNGELPREICEKWGADLLRLWVTSQDYQTDMRFSEAMMVQLAESYRKIRNTFRFALGNLAGFDPARDAVPDNELLEMDAWMLHRTGELVAKCRSWYDDFQFHRVFHALYDFIVVDLSAFYFDVLKDRLYTFAPRNASRRSAQTAIYRITSALLRLAAPILVFTSEEVWKHFPHASGDPESIHMAMFPASEGFAPKLDPRQRENWESLMVIREQVLKKLEEARNAKVINSALEAKVQLRARGKTLELLTKYAAWLPQILIVSQVHVTAANGTAAPASSAAAESVDEIEVARADGKKCERCWNYSTHVGESADYPTICERCLAAIAEIEHSRDGAGGSAGS
ncbi:MAG: isoleucine--tRNA ligase [Candidatus Acidiferrales bacterium]